MCVEGNRIGLIVIGKGSFQKWRLVNWVQDKLTFFRSMWIPLNTHWYRCHSHLFTHGHKLAVSFVKKEDNLILQTNLLILLPYLGKSTKNFFSKNYITTNKSSLTCYQILLKGNPQKLLSLPSSLSPLFLII